MRLPRHVFFISLTVVLLYNIAFILLEIQNFVLFIVIYVSVQPCSEEF